MVRSAKWIAIVVSLQLATAGYLPAQTGPLSSDDAVQPARADYVVDVPSDGDSSEETSSSDDAATTSEETTEESTDREYQHPTANDEPTPAGEQSTNSERPAPELIKERFPDGSVKIEREVTQDAQGNYLNHGAWKMMDQHGNMVAQGQYQFGNRTGTWIRWYRTLSEAELLSKLPYNQFNGPFISQASFKNDQLHGPWTIYDGKKKIISQIEFSDGKRDGNAMWMFANGRKLREVHYKDGEIDGAFHEWTADGKATIDDTYQGGRKVAEKTLRHPGGGKKSEGTYLFAKIVEQTPDDWWNCKLQTTSQQGKDEKHGPWTSWYNNNQKQQIGSYEHDVQVGQFTWWHTNGQKALEGRFADGKQDGVWTWWFPNGQKSIHGEYAHGNPTGRWTWWKEDGKVAQSADLSHSEGVVVETPKALEPNALPHATKLKAGTPRARR